MGTGPLVRDLEREASESSTLVGISKAIQEVRAAIEKFKDTDLIVVIVGLSGVGKEVVARLLHYLSRRSAVGPFVAQNSAALPKDTVHSEVFGHEKGAFTGSVSERMGRFEQAHGGTLFFDEFDDFPIELQPLLLRVLEEKKITRMGGQSEIAVDTRVVIAVKRPLEELLREGRLRSDLFFRINQAVIALPALSERKEDVPGLAEHFLKVSPERRGRESNFSPEALDALIGYDWPGNVRELKIAIDFALVKAVGERIETEDLPRSIQIFEPLTRKGRKPRDRVENQRRAHGAMEKAHGDAGKAAQTLRISVRTLYRWLGGS